MKKTALLLLLVVLLLSVMACELFYEDEYYDEGDYDEEGYYDEEYPEDEYSDDEYGEEAPADNAGGGSVAAISGGDSSADCVNGETYHNDVGLCYLDGGQAEGPFTSMMAGVTEYGDDFEEDLLDDEYVLVRYTIDGNEIHSPVNESVSSDLQDEQDNTALHESIWNFYAAMIPQDARDFVTYYNVATDGLGGTLASVEQDPNDPYSWVLNVDISDTEDLRELTFTLIHEYGHLLTLNEDQIDINEEIFYNPDDDDVYYTAEENCSTYFPGEGCAKSNSYIYLFYREFWTDFYDEWSEIQYIEDDDEYYDALDNFYYKYEDQFVTDYAATNVGEDIAESWAFFITHPRPAGNTIAEEKVLFFYDFPELVQLREEIVARAYSRLIRMQ